MIFKKRNKKIKLFDNPVINEFEKDVASALGTNIYSENKSILQKFSDEELKESRISPAVIESYFINKKTELKRFIIETYNNETKNEKDLKIEDIDSYGPSKGFSLTHAIYFHFLNNDLNKELSQYLERRRIPKSEKFAQRLKVYYSDTKN